MRLPNLEVRYVNTKTSDLDKVYNDANLPLRWYNVGSNTMPNKPPLLDHCGTHFPIYSKGILQLRLIKFHIVNVL